MEGAEARVRPEAGTLRAPGPSHRGVGGPADLEEVVSGADQRPLAADGMEAAHEEPPETAGLFGLAVHRLDRRLASRVDHPARGGPELGPRAVFRCG